LAVPVAATVALGVPLVAAAEEVANYQMNDPVPAQGGARVILDSSGNGLHGDVGSLVRYRQPLDGGNYAFYFPGPFSGYDPERIATVPDVWGNDNARLDPQTQPYAVTLRFRTTASRPNIVQKGQNASFGGFWKFVLKEGWPRCHFRDENGNVTAIGFVKTLNEYKANDGQWHVATCERTATGVRVTLDGVSKFNSGALGNINSRMPLMIGGKLNCNPESGQTAPNGRPVNCDYYQGWIDWLRITKG
jgi:hypothetical protein